MPCDERTPRGFRGAAAAILVVAAGLRFWALDSGLPHPLTRPDEEVVLAQTATLARGERLEWGYYPAAYVQLMWGWEAAGLALGQRFGLLPPGSYATLARDRPEALILVGRAFSALVGAATVGVLMAAARPALGPGGALAAGALLATSFLHVRDSHALKPDALFSLWVVLALWVLVPLVRGATARRAVGAGAVVGLALATKYPAVLLLVPAYVAAVLGTRDRGWRRFLPPAAVVVGLVAAAVFVASSFQTLLSERGRAGIGILVRSLLPAGAPGSITHTLPPGVPSPYSSPWWQGYVYHATFSLAHGAGLLATLLAPAAAAWGFASGRGLPFLAAVFALAYYAVVSITPVHLARYMTPLLPVLALLEAGCLAALAQRVGGRRAALVLVGLTALVAAEPLASAIRHNRIAARTDTRVLATRWMSEHLPPGAVVAVVGTRTWPYGAPRMPPGVRARMIVPEERLLEEAGVSHVLTHDHVLPFSHVDPAALTALAPRLELLADFDPTAPGRPAAGFEAGDAYYIPFHRFAGVVRPGPHVRVYAFRR